MTFYKLKTVYLIQKNIALNYGWETKCTFTNCFNLVFDHLHSIVLIHLNYSFDKNDQDIYLINDNKITE